MLGALLVVICSTLWATDAIFRLPLAKELDASTIVLLEHVICVAATLPGFLLKFRDVKRLNRFGWIAIAFIGIAGSAFGTYFFTLSFRYANPSVTILLQKLQPIIAVVGAMIFLGERPRASFYPWALLALAASTMVSVPELWTIDEIDRGFPSVYKSFADPNRGVVFALVAAAAWGVSTVFGKWVTSRVSFPVTSFLRFGFGLFGTLGLIIFGATDAKVPLSSLYNYFNNDPKAATAIVYMGLVPGVLAMYLYYAGLKRTRASVATFAEMFFPVAAIVINWRVLGQGLAAMQIAGMVLLLLSVFFINRGIK